MRVAARHCRASVRLSLGSDGITEVNCLQWSIAVIGVKGEDCT